MNKNERSSIYSLTREELKSFLIQNGQSLHLAPIIFELLYKKKLSQNISDKTMELLQEAFSFSLPHD